MRTHSSETTVVAEAFTVWGRKITSEKQVTSWGRGHFDDHEMVTLTEDGPILLQLVCLGKYSGL